MWHPTGIQEELPQRIMISTLLFGAPRRQTFESGVPSMSSFLQFMLNFDEQGKTGLFFSFW